MIFLKYVITQNFDSVEWNNALKKSSYSTFFQTVENLEPTKTKFPIFIKIIDNDEIVGQLGLMITTSTSGASGTFFGKLIQFSSKIGNRASWVSGPILHSTDEQYRVKILTTLMEALNKLISTYNIAIIDGYTPPQDLQIDNTYKNIFTKNGFGIENFITLQTSLDKDIEILWNNLKKNARNDVNKAIRDDISVREILSTKDLLKYKQLVKNWQTTKGIKNNNSEIILNRDLKLINSGTQKLFGAFDHEQIVAGLRIGCFNNIAYTHQVLNSYSKSGSVAGSLLSWFAIKWAKNANMKIYDFSGGESPPDDLKKLKEYDEKWKSLFAYKRKWGGVETPYFHFIKIVNKSSYKLFRLLSKPDYFIRNYRKNHFERYRGSSR